MYIMLMPQPDIYVSVDIASDGCKTSGLLIIVFFTISGFVWIGCCFFLFICLLLSRCIIRILLDFILLIILLSSSLVATIFQTTEMDERT
ncbi:hypothetical protein BDW42DRAFT_67562 [Aspergillus taichungensis]|uniref:Uncharacterized protein n=1 Tax=Aspergillus taichungensis TaxID=482145 RepID=A0A2J5I0N1_9EURO|nr:hypothetical protein BDW42DRAFT_67562 [Aspergillus taichungensis]